MNVLKVGNSDSVLEINRNMNPSYGFMLDPVGLYAYSSDKNGFRVYVAAASEYVMGQNFKLINTENEAHYLVFSLFCDHTSDGHCTPEESHGCCPEPTTGTPISNNSNIIEFDSRTECIYDYKLYIYILPGQLYLSPAGIYKANLRIVLQDS